VRREKIAKKISRLRMKTGRDRRWNLAYDNGPF